MPDLHLYTNPRSRGRIAHWMMEEVGQPYTVTNLDYATTMKAPEYLQINPLGKVPALVHGETVVTEYAAICAYLADAFPEAGLVPENRGAYYRFLFFGAGPFEAAIVNAALGVEVPPERRGMVGYRPLGDMLDVLDAWLSAHPFLAGDAFSAADVATGSQIGWGLQFGSIEARPVFTEYWRRLTARPAWGRATAAADQGLQARS